MIAGRRDAPAAHIDSTAWACEAGPPDSRAASRRAVESR